MTWTMMKMMRRVMKYLIRSKLEFRAWRVLNIDALWNLMLAQMALKFTGHMTIKWILNRCLKVYMIDKGDEMEQMIYLHIQPCSRQQKSIELVDRATIPTLRVNDQAICSIGKHLMMLWVA